MWLDAATQAANVDSLDYLGILIEGRGFPLGRKFENGKIGFPEDAVMAWLSRHPTGGVTARRVRLTARERGDSGAGVPARRPVSGWTPTKYVGYAYYTPSMVPLD